MIDTSAKGTSPSARYRHTAVLRGNSMVIYGGYDGGYAGDLFALDLTTFVWTQLVPSTRPPGRDVGIPSRL